MDNQENIFYFIYFIFSCCCIYYIKTFLKKKCFDTEFELTNQEIIDIIENNNDEDGNYENNNDEDGNYENNNDEDGNYENNNNEYNDIENNQVDLSEYTERELKIIRKYGHYKPDASSSDDEL
jgi:hypothetical protein